MSEAHDGEHTTATSGRGPVAQGSSSVLKVVRAILLVLLVLEAILLIRGPHPSEYLPRINAALAADKRPDWWDDASVGIHHAAWINAALILVLRLTCKWWTRSLSAVSNFKSQISNPKWFWPLVALAVLTCLALRYPLASKSLWWDEAWVVQQVSHGKWTPDKKHAGELKFQAHDWSRCAWYYQKPTNHAPMSLLQKASITTWQKLTGAKRDQFTDLAARVPALLASCVAVGLMACLLRAWGRPGAGVAAAFVLALHPWAIRYGVDARAYALVIPLCISGMFAITGIISTRGGKARYWAWWGLTEFFWLWAFPNAVIDIAALNILCAWLLWRSVEKADRGAVLMRLVVTNVFAAMCFIQMFLPNVMQARRWAGQEADKHVLDASVFTATLTNLLAGRDSVPSVVFSYPILVGLFVAFLVRVSVLSCRWSRESQSGLLLLPTLMASALIFAVVTRVADSYFYPRFVIGLLPVVVATLCIDFRSGRVTKTVLAAILAIVLFFAWPQQQLLLTHPYAPLHDVATFVQQEGGGASNKPLITCYGLGREVMPLYEPTCLPVENAAGLESLMQRAKSERRPLYLIYGHDAFNRALLSDGFKLIDDRKLFGEIKAFEGIETEFHFHVLKMN